MSDEEESSTLLSQISEIEEAFSLATAILKYANTKDVLKLGRYLGLQEYDLDTQKTVLAAKCLERSFENFDSGFIASVLIVFLKAEQVVYRELLSPEEYRELFATTLKGWLTDSSLN